MPSPRKNSDLRTVRVIFAIHLVAVILCAFLSLVDTRQVILGASVQQMVRPLLYVVVMLALLCWVICPVAMLLATARLTARSLGFRCAVVFTDVALSAFQIWTMLPSVQ